MSEASDQYISEKKKNEKQMLITFLRYLQLETHLGAMSESRRKKTVGVR